MQSSQEFRWARAFCDTHRCRIQRFVTICRHIGPASTVQFELRSLRRPRSLLPFSR